MKSKKKITGYILAAILIIFTAYVMLDTFVITRVYSQEGQSQIVSETFNNTGVSASGSDENITVSNEDNAAAAEDDSSNGKQSTDCNWHYR